VRSRGLSCANILKDQLLANASHDLRTPLNVIIGYGQLALEGSFGEAPKELQDVIQRMVSSACDQLTLVEDLLNLSRIELNILSVKPVEVPLGPLFDEMKFVLEGLVQGRPVRAEVQALDGDVWIRADPDRLRQILTNLLTNASKFTEEGRIELFANIEHDRVRMGIRDSGIGIAPQHHRAIFEPFCQIDEKRKPSGAGLGLAIARRLSRSMQGALEVESSLGAGSTFWLTLPRVRPAAATQPPRLEAAGAKS
jgi:signal transduction histidine kinase